MICKVFKIPRASWYRAQKGLSHKASQKRGPKPSVSDEALEEEVKGIIWDSDYLDYGYRRIWAILRFDQNFIVGQRRVQKLVQRK
jgi:hypothetical protein